MSIDSSYDRLVTNFCNQTIHNCYYILRMSKCCGYSAIVISPKYSCLRDLGQMIDLQFGPYTFGKTFYIKDGVKTYLYTIHAEVLVRQLVSQLSQSYTVDDCRWSVYQLYYDSECCVSHV
jgi:hypothetical protein